MDKLRMKPMKRSFVQRMLETMNMATATIIGAVFGIAICMLANHLLLG